MRIIINYTNGAQYTIRSELLIATVKKGSHILRLSYLPKGTDLAELERRGAACLELHDIPVDMAADFVRDTLAGDLNGAACRDLIHEGAHEYKKINLKEVESIGIARKGEQVKTGVIFENGHPVALVSFEKPSETISFDVGNIF